MRKVVREHSQIRKHWCRECSTDRINACAYKMPSCFFNSCHNIVPAPRLQLTTRKLCTLSEFRPDHLVIYSQVVCATFHVGIWINHAKRKFEKKKSIFISLFKFEEAMTQWLSQAGSYWTSELIETCLQATTTTTILSKQVLNWKYHC